MNISTNRAFPLALESLYATLGQPPPAVCHFPLQMELSKQAELAVRMSEDQMTTKRLKEYEQELRWMQRAVQHSYQQITAEKIHSQYRKQAIENQLEGLRLKKKALKAGQLARQKGLLDGVQRSTGEEYASQRQKEQSQRIIQQYQCQLQQKIEKCRSKSYQTHRNRQDNNTFNSIVAKSVIEDDIIINKKKKNASKKKNSDKIKQLSTTHRHKQSDQFKTIGVCQTKTSNSFINYGSTKKKPSFCQSQRKQTHNHGKSTLQNKSYIETHRQSQIPNRSTLHTGPLGAKEKALIKIQKRLRLSSIVFKDSKWAHGRHESEHLINTFELEGRLRREVKDGLNNHPSVLKRHAFVVE